MLHVAAIDQIMQTLTQEAPTGLSSATPYKEPVTRLEEARVCVRHYTARR